MFVEGKVNGILEKQSFLPHQSERLPRAMKVAIPSRRGLARRDDLPSHNTRTEVALAVSC